MVRADATQYEGWFYEGAGIYRHVWLNKYQNTHIATDGIFAYSIVVNKKATVTVETTVANEDDTVVNYSINTYLLDKSGKIISTAFEQKFSSGSSGEKISKQNIAVSNPNLWPLENPYLYKLVVDVKKAGKIIDTKILRFGIRTIEIKTNGVFLNGNYVKIHGTNNHQDHAGMGSALPDYLQYYRISLFSEGW